MGAQKTREHQLRLYGHERDSLRRIPPIGFCLAGSEGLDYSKGPPECFVVASGGVLIEGYGHGGSGVCLGDGQTEAEGVQWQGGRAASAYVHAPELPEKTRRPVFICIFEHILESYRVEKPERKELLLPHRKCST